MILLARKALFQKDGVQRNITPQHHHAGPARPAWNCWGPFLLDCSAARAILCLASESRIECVILPSEGQQGVKEARTIGTRLPAHPQGFLPRISGTSRVTPRRRFGPGNTAPTIDPTLAWGCDETGGALGKLRRLTLWESRADSRLETRDSRLVASEERHRRPQHTTAHHSTLVSSPSTAVLPPCTLGPPPSDNIRVRSPSRAVKVTEPPAPERMFLRPISLCTSRTSSLLGQCSPSWTRTEHQKGRNPAELSSPVTYVRYMYGRPHATIHTSFLCPFPPFPSREGGPGRYGA